ncbi:MULTISPECIES: formate/nitrite transporter family protein [unclassified Gemella]|uniref:formate/nitrite transporter family protein n=1 Tax=unclassified Gemella TaxID=2624949 RepID=UPI001C03D9DC|nr:MULTISPECIES: formate/nitrite transporter family protein [unclassified Gemella]MBU0278503.1 formate/nitrite transporter family protein [Gemella sp. zg-1178]QWQ39459.1 formate/nitrite transporter family protein [Gemella sp. zg-570]
MSKLYLEPYEIYAYSAEKGKTKANADLLYKIILGFLGGAFISVGYLAYIRIAGTFPHEWGGFGAFIGAAVFPVGLACILIGGGELITSNMMAVGAAYFSKKIPLSKLINNYVIITLANIVGSLFVAYFFGHIVGLTEGVVLEKTIHTAEAKITATSIQMIISGIGCNWLVSMGAWLSFCAKDVTGKILGAWFPVMTFVAIGFQHVVANMFVIPAAMFAGADITFIEFLKNMVFVWIGNVLGGTVLVAGMYYLAYARKK